MYAWKSTEQSVGRNLFSYRIPAFLRTSPGCAPQVHIWPNLVGFLLSNLTALPQNYPDHALVRRTTTVAPESGALPGPKHTPTARDTAANLTSTKKPTEKWQLLGQVTRKQP